MRSRLITILILIISFTISVVGQEKYEVKEGVVSFFSYAPLENIYAENNKVKSIIDLSIMEFAFVVPIAGFTFKKALMQTHFNEKYLESDKYPNASFSGKLIPKNDLGKSGTKSVTAVGEITIHGVSNHISIPGSITFINNGLVVESEFTLRPREFNIKIPRLFIKNIAEEVLVKVKLTYLSDSK